MGLFGTIGKMAGSKVVKKVEGELAKKQNREQTIKYSSYIKNNIYRIRKELTDLQNNTKILVEEIASRKNTKIPFKERGEFKKTKEQASKNLQYLYLSKDFFTILSKNASGIELRSEELMLITKFAPYFDGTPVIEVSDEESDDSLFGDLKEVGRDLMSIFVSPKKDTSHFDFHEYLYRYREKIEDFVIPDVDNAVESFITTTSAQEASSPSIPEMALKNSDSIDKIDCPNCRAQFSANSKFCPECGSKIETRNSLFCSHCGQSIKLDAKFCSNCGSKI